MNIRDKTKWVKIHPSSKHVTGVSPSARLCGWSNQDNGGPRDKEAMRIHKAWIR